MAPPVKEQPQQRQAKKQTPHRYKHICKTGCVAWHKQLIIIVIVIVISSRSSSNSSSSSSSKQIQCPATGTPTHRHTHPQTHKHPPTNKTHTRARTCSRGSRQPTLRRVAQRATNMQSRHSPAQRSRGRSTRAAEASIPESALPGCQQGQGHGQGREQG